MILLFEIRTSFNFRFLSALCLHTLKTCTLYKLSLKRNKNTLKYSKNALAL